PNSGGARPGAGRKATMRVPPPRGPDAMMPLDYMVRVINDPEASDARKDDLAEHAAAYCHAKVAEAGKKEARPASAENVAATGAFITGSPPPKLVVLDQAASARLAEAKATRGPAAARRPVTSKD